MSFPDKAVLNHLIVYSICVTCGWFYYQFDVSGEAGIAYLLLPDSLSALNENFRYWLLLTPSLIHFTEWHLMGNLLAWWYFARIIGNYSPTWLLLLLLSSAAVSNFTQWMLFNHQFGGLSGVVSALVGFFIGNQLFERNSIFYISWVFVGSYITYLLVVSTGWFGLYSNAAHFSGLFWGIVLAYVFCQWNTTSGNDENIRNH